MVVLAAFLAELCIHWGPEAPEACASKLLARRLDGALPVIYGTGPTCAVARRWKGQLNENAKVQAFWSELPEADHNEICAWGGGDMRAPVCAVFLDDPTVDQRLLRRVDLTAQLIAEEGVQVDVESARGATALERVLSLVLLGDVVSVYLAALAGVDPTPVDTIQRLKAELA